MSSEYWKERQAATQENLTTKSVKQTEKQLAKYYASTMESVLAQFEATYDKLLLTMADGRAPTPADLYKLDKYWQMQAQIRDELTKLGDKQAALLSKNFMKQYAEIYEAIALKDDLHFGKISKETAAQMINQIWCADGKSWSERVWTNTEELREALNEGLIDCVVTGKKTTELKKLLQEKFVVSYNRADSVVRTEMAHIQTQAAQQRYEDYGITEVQVWASKDERRCEVCGKLHKKIYPVGAAMPVPAHPNCRCCIIPVID